MNLNKLRYWLRPTERIFRDFDKYVLDWENNERHRIFMDNGGDVLFVAHLDTVQKPKYVRAKKTTGGKLKRVYARGLDDRLGCMLAYGLAKELGADLLLTDHEESFKTTAKYHNCKDYNWIAEFDRAGEDVVTYKLDSVDFEAALREYWKIGIGSYSDICSLKTLACCVNVGIGYEFAHSKDSYVDIDIMKSQIKKFRQFYADYSIWEYKRDQTYNLWSDGYGGFAECDLCGNPDAEYIFSYCLCERCVEELVTDNLINREAYKWR